MYWFPKPNCTFWSYSDVLWRLWYQGEGLNRRQKKRILTFFRRRNLVHHLLHRQRPSQVLTVYDEVRYLIIYAGKLNTQKILLNDKGHLKIINQLSSPEALENDFFGSGKYGLENFHCNFFPYPSSWRIIKNARHQRICFTH